MHRLIGAGKLDVGPQRAVRLRRRRFRLGVSYQPRTWVLFGRLRSILQLFLHLAGYWLPVPELRPVGITPSVFKPTYCLISAGDFNVVSSNSNPIASSSPRI